jgi:hypothetical protein
MCSPMPQSKLISPRPIAARSASTFSTSGCSLEGRRNGRDALCQPLDLGERQGGIGRVGPLPVEKGAPVDGVLALVVGQHRVDGVLARIHGSAELLDHLVGSLGADHALGDQSVGIQLPRAGVLGDLLVHQRLRHAGSSCSLWPSLRKQTSPPPRPCGTPGGSPAPSGAQHHGFGVVAVHVQDRRLDHLGHVGAVQGGTAVARIAGGEADLVVDDHVHRAAGAVAAGLREVQRLHHDALARERGVAMDQHRHHLLRLGVAAPVWRARTEPSTTGFTISRCEGLKASVRWIGPPGVVTSDEKPWWYFTSPDGRFSGCLPRTRRTGPWAPCPAC